MMGDLSLNRRSTNQSNNIVRNPLVQCKVTSDLINFIFFNSNDSKENITEETISYQTDHNLQFYGQIKSKIQTMESESNPCFLNFQFLYILLVIIIVVINLIVFV